MNKDEHTRRQAKKRSLTEDDAKTLPSEALAYNPHPGDIAVVLQNRTAQQQRTVRGQKRLTCTVNIGGLGRNDIGFRVLGIVKTSGHDTTNQNTTDCIAVDVTGMATIMNNSPKEIATGMYVYAREKPFTADAAAGVVVPGVQVRGRHHQAFTPELFGMYMCDISDYIAQIDHKIDIETFEEGKAIDFDPLELVQYGSTLWKVTGYPDEQIPRPLYYYILFGLVLRLWFDNTFNRHRLCALYSKTRRLYNELLMSPDSPVQKPLKPLPEAMFGDGEAQLSREELGNATGACYHFITVRRRIISWFYAWFDAHLVGKAMTTSGPGKPLDIFRARP